MSENLPRSESISILIVDDHQVLTDALLLIMHHEPDLQVVGVADTCAAARRLFPQTCATILLLDVYLPDGDGLSLIAECNQFCPNTHTLVLTSSTDEKTLTRSIDLGASGFVAKNRPLSEVITAIRQAADGEIVMPSGLLRGLLARYISPSPAATPDPVALTPREKEILTYLAGGMSGPNIAAKLSIAPLTVRTHIRNLMEKLGVHSRLEAVSYALRQGLIKPEL